MGVITLENEFPVAVAPAKLFKAYCLDIDTLMPKILPEHIKSSEIIEGNGGPGTIRKITFTEGKELNYAKQKIEAIDEENLTYSFSLIEADVWKDAVEKVTYEHKFIPTPEGGSICKRTSTYYIKGDAEVNKDQIKDVYGKKTAGLFKAAISSAMLRRSELLLVSRLDF
ncbi:major allergen Pru ar 1-like [Populus alba x Populus x berolinensis]|nr:major allergen Pru ar 1-like [Populus alba x Populus x berolinensis]